MVVPCADIVHMIGMTCHDVSFRPMVDAWVCHVHSYIDSLQVKHTVHFSCQGSVHLARVQFETIQILYVHLGPVHFAMVCVGTVQLVWMHIVCQVDVVAHDDQV